MFHLEDVLQLKDGEQVKSVTRRHVVTLVPSLFLSLVLIVAPFFLLFPLFGWGAPGVALFFTAVVLGVVIAIRALILWDADVIIITNLRLIDVDQRGLLTRTVSEAALSAVQDVSWKRHGLVETAFRIGSVVVQTAGSATTIEARKIPRPEETYELINDLRHTSPPGSSKPAEAREDLLRDIATLLQGYSTEELTRIKSILRARERASVTDAFLKQDTDPAT